MQCLKKSFQTDMGKYYFRLHEHDYNVQEVFHKLSEYSQSSTQASIDTADLLSYVNRVNLHKSNWRGTSHAFILYWCDKVWMYEEMVPHSDHFTGNIKMIMLQNSVAGVSELHQVKTQSDHDWAHGDTTLSYEKYLNLLLAAVSTYDSKRWLTKGRYTCTINQAENHKCDHLGSDINIHDFYFNEDINFDIILVLINSSSTTPTEAYSDHIWASQNGTVSPRKSRRCGTNSNSTQVN